MTMIAAQYAPMYIKKEDAKDYLVKTHNGVALLTIIYPTFIVVMQKTFDFILDARGIDVFSSSSWNLLIMWTYCLTCFTIAINLYSNGPRINEMDKRLKNYKPSEMVKTKLITGSYYNNLILILFLGFCITIFITLVPLFSYIYGMYSEI